MNRANAMVDRSTEHFIDFEADAIVHRRVMSFQNDATSNSWPLGAYKASLRWYLPKNAELIEATVNQLPVGIETLTAEDIREKQVWAVPLEVPTQSSVTVELKYKTPRLFTNNFGYAFFDQKQAGTGPEASKVTIQTANLKPTLIAPTPQQQTSQLIFQNIRRQSSFYAVRFR